MKSLWQITALALVLMLGPGLQAQGEKKVQAINNISDLLFVNPFFQDTVYVVEGYNYSGDGMAGIFRYYSDSVAATNTTICFKPYNYSGRWIQLISSGQTNAGTLIINNLYVTNLFATYASITNLFATYITVSNIVAANIQGTIGTLSKFGPDAFSLEDSIVTQNGTNSITVNGTGSSGFVNIAGTGATLRLGTNTFTSDSGSPTSPLWNGNPIGGGGGGTFNPTSGVMPVNNASTSWDDSPFGVLASARISFGVGDTTQFLYSDISDFSMALGEAAYQSHGSALGLTAVGFNALQLANNGADDNTAIGAFALSAIVNGVEDTAVGRDAGLSLTTANGDTFIGYAAGGALTGGHNTVIGATAGAGPDSTPATVNGIAIGYGVNLTNDNEIVIGNIANTKIIFPITSYDGSGTHFLSDDGTYKSAGGGSSTWGSVDATITNIWLSADPDNGGFPLVIISSDQPLTSASLLQLQNAGTNVLLIGPSNHGGVSQSSQLLLSAPNSADGYFDMEAGSVSTYYDSFAQSGSDFMELDYDLTPGSPSNMYWEITGSVAGHFDGAVSLSPWIDDAGGAFQYIQSFNSPHTDRATLKVANSVAGSSTNLFNVMPNGTIVTGGDHGTTTNQWELGSQTLPLGVTNLTVTVDGVRYRIVAVPF